MPVMNPQTGVYETVPSVPLGTGLPPLPSVQVPMRPQPASDPVSIGAGDILSLGKSAYNYLTPTTTAASQGLGVGGASLAPNLSGAAELANPFSAYGIGGETASSLASEGGSAAASGFSPANIGAGLAGGFAANKVFGGGVGTNVGSTVGGIVGSFGGPIGTAIGSFIGGGIGSMFGNKKPSSKRHTASFDFSNANILDTGYMEGKFSDKNDKLTKGYANLLGSITSGLGAFNEKEQGVGISADNRAGLGFSYGNIPEGTFESGMQNFKTEGEFLNGFFSDFANRFGDRLTPKQKEALSNADFTSGDVPTQLASLSDNLGIDKNKVLEAYQSLHGGDAAAMQRMSTPTPMVAGRKKTNWDEFMQQKIVNEAKKRPPILPNATGSAAQTEQVQIEPRQV